MAPETMTIRRVECIAESATDALTAVDERLRRMRSAGWIIPDDAVVDLRPSGFGWAARLMLPPRDRLPNGSWVLYRRARRPARTVSGVELVTPEANADDANKRAIQGRL